MAKSHWYDPQGGERIRAEEEGGGGIPGFVTQPNDPNMGAGALLQGPGLSQLHLRASATDEGLTQVQLIQALPDPAAPVPAILDMYVEDDQAFESPRDPGDEYKEAYVGTVVRSDDNQGAASAQLDSYRGSFGANGSLSAYAQTPSTGASGSLAGHVDPDGAPTAWFTLTADDAQDRGKVRANIDSKDTQVVITGGAAQSSPLLRVGHQDIQGGLEVAADGQPTVTKPGGGVILVASNGARYKLTVTTAGTLSIVAV